MTEKTLSVVIPTFNESQESHLFQMVQLYPKSEGIEYIVVDNGTEAGLFNPITRPDFHILNTKLRTRAARLNKGIEASKGATVLLHHPRSLIEPEGLKYLERNHKDLSWGGFTHSFSRSHLGLKFTSWYSNRVRPKLGRILYLDHCIFFKRDLLTRQIPDIPIFEDTEISRILAESGSPVILDYISETSAVRFDTNGFLKQAWLNQKMKIQYHLGLSKTHMNSEYERDLNLNG